MLAPHCRDGFAAELAFLAQARSDYPELGLVKAPQELDLHAGTDFLSGWLGVGLTLRDDLSKIVSDFQKAARGGLSHYVVVLLSEDSPLARDSALEALAEVKNLSRGFFLIEASADGALITNKAHLAIPGGRVRVG